jgi:hypothetical protein
VVQKTSKTIPRVKNELIRNEERTDPESRKSLSGIKKELIRNQERTDPESRKS